MPLRGMIENNGEVSALDMSLRGSEPSAASGRYSEASEWQRSKFQASAVRQRRNFGHRNRAERSDVAIRSFRDTDSHASVSTGSE